MLLKNLGSPGHWGSSVDCVLFSILFNVNVVIITKELSGHTWVSRNWYIWITLWWSLHPCITCINLRHTGLAIATTLVSCARQQQQDLGVLKFIPTQQSAQSTRRMSLSPWCSQKNLKSPSKLSLSLKRNLSLSLKRLSCTQKNRRRSYWARHSAERSESVWRDCHWFSECEEGILGRCGSNVERIQEETRCEMLGLKNSRSDCWLAKITRCDYDDEWERNV